MDRNQNNIDLLKECLADNGFRASDVEEFTEFSENYVRRMLKGKTPVNFELLSFLRDDREVWCSVGPDGEPGDIIRREEPSRRYRNGSLMVSDEEAQCKSLLLQCEALMRSRA
jgi:hypothetical protein